MARVSLVNVSKIYQRGETPAVAHVTLDVADGEFVVLVGPSGCGKSTTLRMIAGLEEVSSGSVSIGARDVTQVAPSERDIAMVFQSYALYPHMTVGENLAFALTLRKIPRGEIDRRVTRAATILELGDFLDRKPRQLSGGQRQRVALGRALVREPQVFLFDEPLSNLDAALRSQMRREIAALHRSLGATMIYVTHDQVEAMTLGDRIVVMRGGRVQQVDTPLRLYDAPINRFVAGFIGTPAMNLLECVVDETAGRLLVTGGRESLPLCGAAAGLARRHDRERVTLGVRAEHVTLVLAGGQAHPDAAVLSATVEMVELMGSEMYVYARTGVGDPGVPIVCRAVAHAGVKGADRVALELDMARVHCFNGLTGDRVAD